MKISENRSARQLQVLIAQKLKIQSNGISRIENAQLTRIQRLKIEFEGLGARADHEGEMMVVGRGEEVRIQFRFELMLRLEF